MPDPQFDRVQMGLTQVLPVGSSEEVGRVATLARQIWVEYYVPLIGQAQVDYMVGKFQSEAAIAQQLQQGFEYFLVRRAARDIGYCAVQAQPNARTLFLSKFYLLREERGLGTGRGCMEFIEQLAGRRGLKSVWLTVNKGNPAVEVYQRLGFVITAPLVADIGAGFVMDDFRMEKSLA